MVKKVLFLKVMGDNVQWVLNNNTYYSSQNIKIEPNWDITQIYLVGERIGNFIPLLANVSVKVSEIKNYEGLNLPPVQGSWNFIWKLSDIKIIEAIPISDKDYIPVYNSFKPEARSKAEHALRHLETHIFMNQDEIDYTEPYFVQFAGKVNTNNFADVNWQEPLAPSSTLKAPSAGTDYSDWTPLKKVFAIGDYVKFTSKTNSSNTYTGRVSKVIGCWHNSAGKTVQQKLEICTDSDEHKSALVRSNIDCEYLIQSV